MDEFRVGSLSPSDPYRDQDVHDSPNRKRNRRPKLQGTEEDEVVLSSEQEEAGDDSCEDYYSPGEPTEEP
jgi:hypothetical protein